MRIVCVGPLHPICIFFFGFVCLWFLVWGFHWLWVVGLDECVYLMRLLACVSSVRWELVPGDVAWWIWCLLVLRHLWWFWGRLVYFCLNFMWEIIVVLAWICIWFKVVILYSYSLLRYFLVWVLWYTLVVFYWRDLLIDELKKKNDFPCFDVFSMWVDGHWSQTTHGHIVQES